MQAENYAYTGPRYAAGIAAGVAAGLVGTLVWYLFVVITGFELDYVAWGIGAAVGFATVTAAGDSDIGLTVCAA